MLRQDSVAVITGVNSVSPGTVATSWQINRHGNEGFAEMTARERAVAPLARTLGPEDVADTVLGPPFSSCCSPQCWWRLPSRSGSTRSTSASSWC